jgi:hypothetical protein
MSGLGDGGSPLINQFQYQHHNNCTATCRKLDLVALDKWQALPASEEVSWWCKAIIQAFHNSEAIRKAGEHAAQQGTLETMEEEDGEIEARGEEEGSGDRSD